MDIWSMRCPVLRAVPLNSTRGFGNKFVNFTTSTGHVQAQGIPGPGHFVLTLTLACNLFISKVKFS